MKTKSHRPQYPTTLWQLEARLWRPVPGLHCGPFPGGCIGALVRSLDIGAVMNLQREDDTDYLGRPFEEYRLPDYVGTARFPITDVQPPDTQKLAQDAVYTLCRWLFIERVNVYLHCWGGHGRTGTIVGCLLRQFGYNADDALGIIRQSRIDRDELRNRPAPQTHAQRQFIRDYLPAPFPSAGSVPIKSR